MLSLFVLVVIGAGIYILYVPPGKSSKNPKDYVTPDIYTKAHMIGEVSVTEFYKDNHTKKPVVVLLHGLSGSMSDTYYLAAELANHNLFVVCMDAYGHGDTVSDDFVSASEIVVRSSQNLDKILPYYKNNENANLDQLNLTGFSLGAEITYHYCAYGTFPVSHAVTCCGTPDFEELIDVDIAYSKFLKGKWKNLKSANDKSEVNALLREQNPLNQMERLRQTTFFIMVAENDTTMPTRNSIEFYQQIKESSPDSMYKLYEKHTHTFDDIFMNDIQNYIFTHIEGETN